MDEKNLMNGKLRKRYQYRVTDFMKMLLKGFKDLLCALAENEKLKWNYH